VVENIKKKGVKPLEKETSNRRKGGQGWKKKLVRDEPVKPRLLIQNLFKRGGPVIEAREVRGGGTGQNKNTSRATRNARKKKKKEGGTRPKRAWKNCRG